MHKLLAVAVLSAFVTTLTACGGPSGPRYQDVRSFSEGLAAVKAGNAKWGFINEGQRWVIQPRFDDAKDFQGGKAAVKLNGKWGFINKRGEWL